MLAKLRTRLRFGTLAGASSPLVLDLTAATPHRRPTGNSNLFFYLNRTRTWFFGNPNGRYKLAEVVFVPEIAVVSLLGVFFASATSSLPPIHGSWMPFWWIHQIAKGDSIGVATIAGCVDYVASGEHYQTGFLYEVDRA
jgi:hypothetical protein